MPCTKGSQEKRETATGGRETEVKQLGDLPRVILRVSNRTGRQSQVQHLSIFTVPPTTPQPLVNRTAGQFLLLFQQAPVAKATRSQQGFPKKGQHRLLSYSRFRLRVMG